MSTFKTAFELPPGASFDDYLHAHVPSDPKCEAFFDPLSPGDMSGGPGGSSSGSREAAAAGAAEAAGAGEAADLAALEAELASEYATAAAGHDGDAAAGTLPEHSQQDGSGLTDGPSRPAAAAASSSRRSFWGTSKPAQNGAAAQPSTSQPTRSAGATSTSQPQPAATAAGTAGAAGSGPVPGKARVIKARCWMAQDFPMSLQQLLPLLDVIGTANKQLAKVGKFMRKYGAQDMSLFPVKVG